MYQTDSYGWPRNGTLFDGAIGLFQKKKIQMTTHGVNISTEFNGQKLQIYELPF